jgi:hypothetical protein
MKFKLLIALLWCSVSLAAIPRASMILQRTSENAGKGIYQIEQEVQFPNGQDVLVLKETWLIENENNMKLVVTGAKELKDQVSFVINVSNGNHSESGSSKRITEDFIERYFHLQSTESFIQVLNQLRLIPAAGINRKPFRRSPKDKEFEYPAENYVHLARSGGAVTYAFGGIAMQEKEPPGFWIEQDQFLIRKFRLPTGVEVTADRYSAFAKGLMYPRTQVVRWGANQVTIQTISVNARSKEAWAQFNPKVANRTEALRNQAAGPLVEEFYKRFR